MSDSGCRTQCQRGSHHRQRGRAASRGEMLAHAVVTSPRHARRLTEACPHDRVERTALGAAVEIGPRDDRVLRMNRLGDAVDRQQEYVGWQPSIRRREPPRPVGVAIRIDDRVEVEHAADELLLAETGPVEEHRRDARAVPPQDLVGDASCFVRHRLAVLGAKDRVQLAEGAGHRLQVRTKRSRSSAVSVTVRPGRGAIVLAVDREPAIERQLGS